MDVYGAIATTGLPVAPQLSAYRRGRSVDQAGDPSLTKAFGQAELDSDTFFDAEFVVGHRATPYRKGQVLHSIFAAAPLT